MLARDMSNSKPGQGFYATKDFNFFDLGYEVFCKQFYSACRNS